jgi:hypothetical protein
MSGPLNCIIIGFGATSKRIDTSPSSRIRRILSPLSSMLIGPICNRSVIQCSTKSSPKLKYWGYLTCLGCIRNGTLSWLLSFVPLLGAVEMAESTINFSIEGHKFNLCVTEFPTIFRLAPNGLHRPEVITDRTLVENELALRYVSRNYGTSHGLLPKYTIFNNIFYNTLTPKRCDRTNIWGSTRNLLLFILNDQSPLYISTFL